MAFQNTWTTAGTSFPIRACAQIIVNCGGDELNGGGIPSSWRLPKNHNRVIVISDSLKSKYAITMSHAQDNAS